MIPYQKEKMENAVCFFAHEHRKKTRHQLYQTFLYKYLALFDFGYLRKYGNPPLSLTYKAMPRGPVPMEIYGHRDDPALSEAFTLQEDASKNFLVIPRKTPDLDYFSQREVQFMHNLIEIYAQTYTTSRIMSDASHQEIKAWRKTYSRQQNAVIDFALEFDGDISTKPEENLTFPEEVYLVQKGLETCSSPSVT